MTAGALNSRSKRRLAATCVACGFLFVQAITFLVGLSAWADETGFDLVRANLAVAFLPTQFATVFAWRLSYRLAVPLTALPVVLFVALPFWLSPPNDVKLALIVSVMVFGPAVMMATSFLLVGRSRAATLAVFALTLPVLALGAVATASTWGFDPITPNRLERAPGPSGVEAGLWFCLQMPLCFVVFIGCVIVRLSWAAVGPGRDECDVEFVEDIPPEIIPVIPVRPKTGPKVRADASHPIPPDATEMLRGADLTPLAQSRLLATLAEAERPVIHRCLYAVASGRFVNDDDFPTVVGVTRPVAKAIIDARNPPAALEEATRLAVAGALNGLLLWHAWQEDAESADRVLVGWTGATAAELSELLAKWSTSDLGQPPPQ